MYIWGLKFEMSRNTVIGRWRLLGERELSYGYGNCSGLVNFYFKYLQLMWFLRKTFIF